MPLNLDSEAITIKCPHCSVSYEETICRLKYEPRIFCPDCGRAIGVNLLELYAALDSVQKSSRDFLRRLIDESRNKGLH